MGAGASVEGLPQDKMDRFKEKILALDTLNENQKSRLLETMNYELKKLQPPKSDKVLWALHFNSSQQSRSQIFLRLGICRTWQQRRSKGLDAVRLREARMMLDLLERPPRKFSSTSAKLIGKR